MQSQNQNRGQSANKNRGGYTSSTNNNSSSTNNYKGTNSSASKNAGQNTSRRNDMGTGSRKAKDGLNVYILRLLKDMHPDCGITRNGMRVMNSFNLNLVDTIATEAATLMRYQKAQTLSSQHILGAIKLCLPPDLAASAGEECKRALDLYEKNKTATNN